MQMINALKTQYKKKLYFEKTKPYFQILQVLTAQHTSLAISDLSSKF